MSFRENRNKEFLHKFEKIGQMSYTNRQIVNIPDVYIIQKGTGILKILSVSKVAGLDLFGKTKYDVTVRDKHDRRDEVLIEYTTLVQAMKTMQEIGNEYPEYGL